MNKFGVVAFFCLVPMVITSCARYLESGTEDIHAEFPNAEDKGGWQINSSEKREESIYTSYKHTNENTVNWTELIEYHNVRKSITFPTMESMVAQIKATWAEHCKTATQKVVEQHENDILFQITLADCSDKPDQIRITRLFYGRWNIFRLTYIGRNTTQEQIDHVTNVWSNASVSLKLNP